MTHTPTIPIADLHYDPELPITAWREEIVDAICHHQVIVVAGETGSGKTTQLPKMALEAGRRTIGHTQPRRIAARSVAERIAQELHSSIGELVGYQVRFTRKAGRNTRLKVMTDGVLLNEITYDPMLRRYDTIIIDEAHERSLNIDFLLGYLKQLLARRPELKIIVTSATIDTQRFSEHFDNAPVIEVSGRTYPVEIRYRPIRDDGAVLGDDDEMEILDRRRKRPGAVAEINDKDQLDAIGDAVLELSEQGDGDILVFLSGEREITDTAEYLSGLELRFTEVIPLYARLSAAEQHRVFSSHTGRRIVLATNVAETSLTVPGIRYVIDAGTARISRYSSRTKVQRLPIEPISQASANQRAGRCGRVAPGVCIRLYSQQDFELRPEFTEPEILRTNLASVILQMAEAKLGDIADFPFVEAPDRSQINDGLRLLDELGALSSGKSAIPKLTPIGRQLARMPVDPRLGRMLIEAHRQGALSEVVPIVAGLSIQDPRERPNEQRDLADASHRRFWSDAILGAETATVNSDRSDFLVLLRIWRYVRRQQKELSGNGFRKMCREEYLNYLRIREWQDLVAQLDDVCRELSLAKNTAPASADRIHTAILSGLLSHIGLIDTKDIDPNLPARKRVRLGPSEYVGARGSRFAINRGSSIAKNSPPLVMAYELVETTRLWARTAAEIDARMVEEVAGHLLKRSYSEPHWSSKRGAAQAYEKVSLLGVPIVAQRLVDYARINPAEARSIFIQSALVEGDWHTRHHFFARNQQVREQAEEMEQRTRRTDITISDEELADFYQARIPEQVVSQTHFDKWWREQRRSDEFILDLTLADLLVGNADDFDTDAFPDDWTVAEHQLAISYTFDPGAGHDGVEVAIPLGILNQLDSAVFTWQVPGLRQELATELIRSLPKRIRTSFVPAPNFAQQAMAWIATHPQQQRATLSESLAVALRALTGADIPDTAWNLAAVPEYLHPTFVITDGSKEIARGNDLRSLQQELSQMLSKELTQAAHASAKTGEITWVFGTIPEQTEFQRGATTVVGYPALVDEVRTVGLAVVDTKVRQCASHKAGLRRLVFLAIPDPTKWVVAHMSMSTKLGLATSPYASVPILLADARLASVGELIAGDKQGYSCRDESSFVGLKDRVRADHPEHMRRVVDAVADTLTRHQDIMRTIEKFSATDAITDITEQLKGLIFPGFIAATPDPYIWQLPRYLHAIQVRLQNLATNPARDRQHHDTMLELEDAYADLCAAQPVGPLPESISDIGWAMEELRVSLFAQQLGTRIPISAKRLRTMLAAASS
ncbi:MAG: ATP-dependent RNA helicase HrpA [Propionibacteriaceae bacterium]